MKKRTAKYYALGRDIGDGNTLLENPPAKAESRAQFALDAIERLGYVILEFEPPEDPNQTKFDF